MQPKIVAQNKRYITGMFGNVQKQGQLWEKVKKGYAESPFARSDEHDCRVYFWEMANLDKTVFFGYETDSIIISDKFITIEFPACEWAMFEVEPAKWWVSGDADVQGWIANNEQYKWRKYDGSIYQLEYYKEKFKGSDDPDSRMEVWYPLEKIV